jgi:hypothetical protein
VHHIGLNSARYLRPVSREPPKKTPGAGRVRRSEFVRLPLYGNPLWDWLGTVQRFRSRNIGGYSGLLPSMIYQNAFVAIGLLVQEGPNELRSIRTLKSPLLSDGCTCLVTYYLKLDLKC